MPEQGYIRDKLDLMFLILFVLNSINRPVGFDDILEMALLDESIGYFECSEAFYEMVERGHIEHLDEGYVISKRGKDVLVSYDNRLPSSVRRHAQRAVLKTAARLRREACISCETVQNGPDNYTCSMRLSDGMDEILRLDMLVVNRAQASMLENNLRNNADEIYNAVLAALLKDYSEGKAEEK